MLQCITDILYSTPVSLNIARSLRLYKYSSDTFNSGVYKGDKYYPPESNEYLSIDNYNLSDDEVLAPTYGQVSNWLLTTYGIHIILCWDLHEDESMNHHYIKYMKRIRRYDDNSILYDNDGMIICESTDVPKIIEYLGSTMDELLAKSINFISLPKNLSK